MKYLALLVLLVGCQAGVELEPVVSAEEARINFLVDASVKIDVTCNGEDAGSGSGSVISTTLSGTSKVLTAAHLYEEGMECTFSIVNSKQEKFNGTVIGRDVDADLMLLHVDQEVGPYTPVAAHSFIGEAIICIGYPVQRLNDEVTLSITTGTLSTRFDKVDRVDNDIYFGSSGGACFNNQNQVVGVVSFMLISGISNGYPVPLSGQFFVVSASTINTFLESLPL